MTFGDEDAPRPRQRFTPLSLETLGVAELDGYIVELRAEIARVEADIVRKQDVRSAADRFFKM